MDVETAKHTAPDSVSGSLTLLPAPQTRMLPPPARAVSDSEFEKVVRGALDAVGGTLLFKMTVEAEGAAHHAAAAAVGTGETRQFLLLTLPVNGGRLKVETTARSASPLAGIAASYAGLLDVFKAAA